MQYEIARPYLLFLGEQTSAPHAKTACGLRARGARSLVIGIAPIGVSIPISWSGVLIKSLEAALIS
jgi:hypothetical protein